MSVTAEEAVGLHFRDLRQKVWMNEIGAIKAIRASEKL